MGCSIYDLWILSLLRFLINSILTYTRKKAKYYRKMKDVGYQIFSLFSILYTIFKMLTRLILGVKNEEIPYTYFAVELTLTFVFIILESFLIHKLFIKKKKKKKSEVKFSKTHSTSDMSIPLLGEEIVEKEKVNVIFDDDEEENDEETKAKKEKDKSSLDDDDDKIEHYKIMMKLLKLIWVDKVVFFGAVFCLIIAAACDVGIPHFTGEIISYASLQDSAQFELNMILLVLTSITSAIFSGFRGSLFTVIMAKQNVRVRRNLLTSLFKQEIGFYDVSKVGDLTSRLSVDTSKVSSGVALNLNIFIRYFIQAVGILIFMFYSNWKLTLVAFITVPVVVILTRSYSKYYADLEKDSQKTVADANIIAEESLSSMFTIRSLNGEKEELDKFDVKLMEYQKLQYKEAIAYTAYFGVTSLLPNMVTVLLLYYGGKLMFISSENFSTSTLISFMLYQQSLSNCFNNMGYVISGLAGTNGAAHKVFKLTDREAKEKERGTLSFPNEGLKGEIIFKDVSFRYPARMDRLVLKGISFTIKEKTTTAFCGPSGSGKSSIIRLIERFYDPDDGKVMLDGRGIHEYNKHWLHSRIALVSQEPVLFGRSIKDNILFGTGEEGERKCTFEDVVEASRRANAHDFIMQMPKGYDTNIGEKGVQLSGGQKQRIAIARALIRRPSILLLDEATSALDAESEASVQEALDSIIQNKSCTIVIIAHRLSTIRDADNIICMSEGKIIEEGTHNLLLKKEGLYASLVKRQMVAED